MNRVTEKRVPQSPARPAGMFIPTIKCLLTARGTDLRHRAITKLKDQMPGNMFTGNQPLAFSPALQAPGGPTGRMGVPFSINIGIDGYLAHAEAMKLYVFRTRGCPGA
jgi:hypothetical protein